MDKVPLTPIEAAALGIGRSKVNELLERADVRNSRGAGVTPPKRDRGAGALICCRTGTRVLERRAVHADAEQR